MKSVRPLGFTNPAYKGMNISNSIYGEPGQEVDCFKIKQREGGAFRAARVQGSFQTQHSSGAQLSIVVESCLLLSPGLVKVRSSQI